MLKKFFLILTLILIPLTANAETYVDPKGRFQFEIPPGWTLATEKEKIESNVKCPVCGQELTFEGGCNSCKSCGYSKCD